jgi:hypothetical protein
VLLPVGKFFIDGALEIPPHTTLKGTSQELSTLYFMEDGIGEQLGGLTVAEGGCEYYVPLAGTKTTLFSSKRRCLSVLSACPEPVLTNRSTSTRIANTHGAAQHLPPQCTNRWFDCSNQHRPVDAQPRRPTQATFTATALSRGDSKASRFT